MEGRKLLYPSIASVLYCQPHEPPDMLQEKNKKQSSTTAVDGTAFLLILQTIKSSSIFQEHHEKEDLNTKIQNRKYPARVLQQGTAKGIGSSSTGAKEGQSYTMKCASHTPVVLRDR